MSQLAERQDYEESLKTFRDWYSVIKTAENKGRNERSVEIARNMKNRGFSNDEIILLTGLTEDEINDL